MGTDAADGLFDFGDSQAQRAAINELSSTAFDAHHFYGPVVLDANEPDRYSKSKRMNKFRDIPEVDYPVWAIALSPLGRFIASSQADASGSAVLLWETKKFEVLYTIKFHESTVWALEFSPNGAYLATGSEDKTIGLWDVSAERIQSMQKDADDDKGGKGGKATSQRLLTRLVGGHTAAIRRLSFSQSGLLISGGSDNHLCLWEGGNPWPLQRWQAHEDDVMDCFFSTDNPDMAFSLGQDGTIALWRAIDGMEGFKCRFKGGGPASGGVLCMALHGIDFYMLATGTQEGSAFVHYFHPAAGNDVTDGCVGCKKFQHEMRGHTGAIWTTSFSKDGCLLATGSADKTVRVWDVHLASYDAMDRAHPGKEIVVKNKILAAASLPQIVTDVGIRHGDRGEVKKLAVRVEDGVEVREAEVMWNRLNTTTWIDLVNIKNDLETAYAENYPIVLQVAFFEAHQSFVRQLRWRKGAKTKTKERGDAREEHTLVTCSPDGTIKIWTSPKQLCGAREWDQKHHPPQAAALDDDEVVPTPAESPSAADAAVNWLTSPALALTDNLAPAPAFSALTDLGRPPALSALGELPALPPLPKLENVPSSSALRFAGSGNEAAASANTTLAR